jgi:uncharacterized protein YndB with AHSA1/START domain
VTLGEVVATTRVGLALDDAFRAFTGEVDRWWRRDSTRPDAVVKFEGDRLVSVTTEGVVLLAEVAQWSPPSLMELRWHGPHAELGDVVVVELAPDDRGTRITIRHRRDGLAPADAMASVLGLWWGDALSRLSSVHRSPPKEVP